MSAPARSAMPRTRRSRPGTACRRAISPRSTWAPWSWATRPTSSAPTIWASARSGKRICDRRGRRRRAGWEYLHVAIDDHARLAYTEILPDERGATCAAFLARAAAWLEACDVAVQRVMTDNAFAYTQSRDFQAALRAIGARHLTTRPYRPRTNGKAERFIQTCLREWLYARPYPTSHARIAAMPDWLHTYNHHRPHAGLQGLTPVQRLNNVLGNDT
jgi:transposase InsO family protein